MMSELKGRRANLYEPCSLIIQALLKNSLWQAIEGYERL